MGFTSKILNNSISSLQAQQAVIATTSNNIANASTPGYARRQVDLSDRSGSQSGSQINVGDGVEIGKVTQIVDQFIEKLVQGSHSDKSAADTTKDFLSRAQSIFALDGKTPTIGSTLTAFQNAANTLASDPSNISLRSNLLQAGTDLVSTLSQSYNSIASLQDEANARVTTEISNVNTDTTQIASLNGLISAKEANGGVASDERDQRTKLLDDLAQKVSFSTVEDSSGSVSVYLQKGFALVSGTTARTLDVTTSPSFSNGNVPPSLSGKALSYVVFDYGGTGAAQVDLTKTLEAGGGTVGALLKLRGYNDVANSSPFLSDGSLVTIASQIEGITRNLLTSVNKAYLGPTDEDGNAANGFQPTSGALDGTSPSPFGLFDFQYSGSNPKDVNADGSPTNSDLNSNTLGIYVYSNIIKMGVTDPNKVAAAVDSNAAANATSFSSGDGQNILRLVDALKNTNQTFSVGTYSFTGSLNQAYNQAVTNASSVVTRATTDANVASSNLQTAQSRRDSVSGVNLDEEFTSLIQFQRAFQASSRMIKVADDLMQQIVSLI